MLMSDNEDQLVPHCLKKKKKGYAQPQTLSDWPTLGWMCFKTGQRERDFIV